ncbi:hypothetical protein [Corynebacterium sp. CCM 9204]|uniref:hypothetical protein n=1 Tax=Corynebacterium sp. CCM 9204 TaxID=3057616 RepID=UPI00352526B7
MAAAPRGSSASASASTGRWRVVVPGGRAVTASDLDLGVLAIAHNAARAEGDPRAAAGLFAFAEAVGVEQFLVYPVGRRSDRRGAWAQRLEPTRWCAVSGGVASGGTACSGRSSIWLICQTCVAGRVWSLSYWHRPGISTLKAIRMLIAYRATGSPRTFAGVSAPSDAHRLRG